MMGEAQTTTALQQIQLIQLAKWHGKLTDLRHQEEGLREE